MLNTSADFAFASLDSLPLPGKAASKQVVDSKRQQAFNARLEAVLRGTANAYGAFAAELWLLDDQSKQLARHTAWEQTAHQTTDTAPRSLASADADVAALAGGAVVLEHPAEILQWQTHRPAAAAVCLPVSSDTTIHGVFWLHFDEQREISDSKLEMIEIVAGRLAVELERETLLAAAANTANDSESVVSEPTVKPSTAQQGELELANWSNREHVTDQSIWSALPDGKILAFSSSIIPSPGITLEQAIATIEQTNELAYQLAANINDAGDLLTQLNHLLYETMPDSAGVAFALALLNEEGVGTIATAGPSMILQVRAAQTESMVGDNTPLAWDIEAQYSSTPIELLIRQRLLLLTGTPQLTSPLKEREFSGTFRVPTSEAHRAMTAQECIERLVRTGSEELNAITAIRRV